MFDELARLQSDVALQLKAQLEGGVFAPVNLFEGPRHSQRMSAAMECIRVLECQNDGAAHCSCSACNRAQTLSWEEVLIISCRDHKSVINTALATWERLGTDFSKRLVIRTIRTLLHSYHPQISTLEAAGVVSDLLIDLQGAGESDQKQRMRDAQRLRTAVKALLQAAKRNPTVTIAQVRAIGEWISRSAIGSQRRYIILEAIEETNPSARNALLKMLEEPPSDVYFFLISEHPGRIMETILSRSRRTRFAALTQEAVAAYLEPFYPTKEYTDLERFYLEEGGLDLIRLGEIASLLLRPALGGTALSSLQLAELMAEIDTMEGHSRLGVELLAQVEERMAGGELTAMQAARMGSTISSTLHKGELYNQERGMMVEALYYRLLGDV